MRKEPEYYLETGYEDHGYLSPELSSSDTYPSYIEEEVKECVKKIQAHQNHNTITFAFMADVHYAAHSYNHTIRFQRTMNAYKEIKKRAHIDKLILGGDHTNEGCKEYKENCLRELRALLGDTMYYPINGNHDDGTIWDMLYLKADKWTNHLEPAEQYRLFYNHLDGEKVKFDRENESLYYYVDDNEKKVRYIMLDSNNVPYIYEESGKLKYDGMGHYTFSQKQLDWLCGEALSFSEEGWSVILFTHSVELPDGKYSEQPWRKGSIILNKILKAYAEKSHLKAAWGEDELSQNVDVDFSAYITADIMGIFVGDFHQDYVCYNENIPYMLTGNAVMYFRHEDRVDGTASELLFDVVTVDKKERTIYITRVGSGEDRVVKY